jgi:hypothetical protein
MKTIIRTGNRSKVKTGNPKTLMVTGIRSRVLGGGQGETDNECFRLLENGDFRILENGDFRILEQCDQGFNYTLNFPFI